MLLLYYKTFSISSTFFKFCVKQKISAETAIFLQETIDFSAKMWYYKFVSPL